MPPRVDSFVLGLSPSISVQFTGSAPINKTELRLTTELRGLADDKELSRVTQGRIRLVGVSSGSTLTLTQLERGFTIDAKPLVGEATLFLANTDFATAANDPSPYLEDEGLGYDAPTDTFARDGVVAVDVEPQLPNVEEEATGLLDSLRPTSSSCGNPASEAYCHDSFILLVHLSGMSRLSLSQVPSKLSGDEVTRSVVEVQTAGGREFRAVSARPRAERVESQMATVDHLVPGTTVIDSTSVYTATSDEACQNPKRQRMAFRTDPPQGSNAFRVRTNAGCREFMEMSMTPLPSSFSFCQADDNDCLPIRPDGSRAEANLGSMAVRAASRVSLDMFDCLSSNESCATEKATHGKPTKWPSTYFPGDDRKQGGSSFSEVKQLSVERLTSYRHERSTGSAGVDEGAGKLNDIGLDTERKVVRGEIWSNDQHAYLYDVQADRRVAVVSLTTLSNPFTDYSSGRLNCPSGTGFFAPANINGKMCSSAHAYPPGLTSKLEVSVERSGKVVGDGIACGDVAHRTCGREYPVDQAVVLTATPTGSSRSIDRWLEDCTPRGSDPTCKLVMSRDRKARIRFRE